MSRPICFSRGPLASGETHFLQERPSCFRRGPLASGEALLLQERHTYFSRGPLASAEAHLLQERHTCFSRGPLASVVAYFLKKSPNLIMARLSHLLVSRRESHDSLWLGCPLFFWCGCPTFLWQGCLHFLWRGSPNMIYSEAVPVLPRAISWSRPAPASGTSRAASCGPTTHAKLLFHSSGPGRRKKWHQTSPRFSDAIYKCTYQYKMQA